jgi:hypothetical protein
MSQSTNPDQDGSLGNEFTASKCQVEFLDTNWKVLDSDKDEVNGTRLETP